MTRYIGLDLHKMYVHGCEWTPAAPDRQKAKHFRFPNTQEGWTWLVNQVDRTCRVALEVTGSAFEIYDRLSPHVEQVLPANAREMKRLGSKRHTDRVDAARLAKALALDLLPVVWVPPLPMREVRRLLHYRDRLTRGRRRSTNQAKRIFLRHGILLSAHADAHHAASTHDLSSLPSGDRVILGSALRQAAAVEAEILVIESEIAARVQRIPEVRQLLTITNVGIVAATAIWAALGDPHRFAHTKQVARYAGLDPSCRQSGEELRRGRISKNGNTLLRSLLVEVALGVGRHDQGALGQFYRRKKAQIGHSKAVVALARKILIVAWRMLLTGEDYRTSNARQVTRKHRLLDHLAERTTASPVVALNRTIAEMHSVYARVHHRRIVRTAVPA
ncbi:MAG: IS110 family transposase [Chloroflexi bacterium]|nr:IS110 family transposase [Chloroflexota bacterium]